VLFYFLFLSLKDLGGYSLINETYLLVNKVRDKKPLIHHITNYVTVNDCANITLAIGASPVMADSSDEVEDIVSISSALLLNMGTLHFRTIYSMKKAGKKANSLRIPIVLDPVGVGASRLRNDTALQLVEELNIDVLRGNISEIKYFAHLHSGTKGVDAAEEDTNNLDAAIAVAKKVALKLKCVVAITGAIDIVSDGEQVICIKNGHPMLSNLTGTGCMCSSLIASFCGVNPRHPFEATVAALLTMGIAGEIAYEAAGHLGNGSFHMALHDAVSRMNAEILEQRASFL
jgi:hydroxyethylthiazole kinase